MRANEFLMYLVFYINVPILPGGTVMSNSTLCIFSDKCRRRIFLGGAKNRYGWVRAEKCLELPYSDFNYQPQTEKIYYESHTLIYG